MDGELVLVVRQTDGFLHIEVFFKNHMPVICLSHLYFLIEEDKATEHGPLLGVAIAQIQRIDDVQTVLPAYQQFTSARTIDGTLVKRTRLQTVTVVEATYREHP